jgi:hypothetical protein
MLIEGPPGAGDRQKRTARDRTMDVQHVGGARLRQVRDLPCPPGLPLLGNFLQLRPDRLHTTLEEWAQKLRSPY